MPKTRIALLHYASPPVVGGVESTIGAQARLLTDAGYDVRIVTGRGDCFDTRVPVEVIPELGSSHPRVLGVQRALAAGVVDADFRSLVLDLSGRLSAALDVDVCIAHNLLTLHKNLAATAALRDLSGAGAVRLVAWSHDFAWSDPIYAPDVHPGFPWDLLRQPWRGVRNVVVSDSRRQELASLLEVDPGEIKAIPPGIDPLEFLGVSAAAASWTAEFGLLEAAPLLLLPARVTRRKNIELAIEITAALRSQ
ncbi:MAG: glycosyltransferase, partial [Rudaea sp.]